MKKRLSIIIALLLTSSILVLLASFINHKIKLAKEDALFVPIGQLVEVDGNQMHVYTEGDGEESLVFMSGGGTSSPALDFKSLYSILSKEYKIVLVEKAGYGFSDITNSSRDIDTILYETREALKEAQIEGPFILFPHSMSGIEALYWAQLYPNEVKSIIGLDMAVPEAYEKMKINMPLVRLGSIAAQLGVTRWIPNLAESDAIKYGRLTEEEKDLYRTVFYRRTASKNMINEVKHIEENAQIVKENGIPNIPILMFSSNGEETGFKEKEWLDIQRNFSNENNSELIQLNSSHYIHNIDYEKIARESKIFIEKIKAH